jgi:hypothetical protein
VTRRLEVDPERIDRWVAGFAARHGATDRILDGPRLLLSAADGARASLTPFASKQSSRPTESESLAEWAAPPARLGLVLVRRGGYAVGLAEGDTLTAHKCGTRYVQSRTAAGGWSQQRFARRRGNQAEALVGSVVEHVIRLVVPPAAPSATASGASAPSALVVGGDRGLVRDVLAHARLAPLERLPRRELFDLPDPRLEVLRQALRRGRAVRVRLDEPDGLGTDVTGPRSAPRGPALPDG